MCNNACDIIMNLLTICISFLTLILDSLVGMFSGSNSTEYSVYLTCFMCIIIIIEPSILSIDRFILKPPYARVSECKHVDHAFLPVTVTPQARAVMYISCVCMCASILHFILISVYISVNKQTDFLHIVSLCISNSHILHLISYNCMC